MMLINVKDIPVTGREYELHLEGHALDIEVKLLEPLHFQGTLYKSGEDVRVVGKLMTSIDVSCHRCLEAFPLYIYSDLDLFYQPYTGPQLQENIPIEELGILYYKDYAIDLFPALHDTVILEIPMQLLCKEDCRGLCIHCGSNLNHNHCDCQTNRETYNPFKDFFQKHNFY